MKISSLLLLSFLLTASAQAQVPAEIRRKADSTVAEGKRLFRSEMASWHGTDLFLEQGGDQKRVGGYFSYLDGPKTNFVMLSNDEQPVAICTVTFDSLSKKETAILKMENRSLTALEKDYLSLRAAAKLAMQDSFYESYQNTSPNIIPVIRNGERMAYVITGTSAEDMVIFGNDYLFRFDAQNRLLSREKLHRNILPAQYRGKDNQPVIGGIHSHIAPSSELITATDICTIMLY